MSDNNGAAPESRAKLIAHLARDLAAKSAELEALAAWAEAQEERQASLETLAAEAEEDRQDRDKGIIWLNERNVHRS